jgi:hypothetical protein
MSEGLPATLLPGGADQIGDAAALSLAQLAQVRVQILAVTSGGNTGNDRFRRCPRCWSGVALVRDHHPGASSPARMAAMSPAMPPPTTRTSVSTISPCPSSPDCKPPTRNAATILQGQPDFSTVTAIRNSSRDIARTGFA